MNDVVIVSGASVAKEDGLLKKIEDYFGPNTAKCFETWLDSPEYSKGTYRLMWNGSPDNLEISPLDWKLMHEYVTVFSSITGHNSMEFHSSHCINGFHFSSRFLESNLGQIVSVKDNVLFLSKNGEVLTDVNQDDDSDIEDYIKITEARRTGSLVAVDILPDYKVEDIENMGSEKYPDMWSGFLNFDVIASYCGKKFNLHCGCDTVGSLKDKCITWRTFDHIDFTNYNEDPYVDIDEIMESVDSDEVCDFFADVLHMLEKKVIVTFFD